MRTALAAKSLPWMKKKQRQALIARIHDKGYKEVMEEAAYTWFNRFSALRFMEVNGVFAQPCAGIYG